MAQAEYPTFADMPPDVLESFCRALDEVARKAYEKEQRKRPTGART